MISLRVLRPIQIVDVSYQLMRNKFISSFIIAFLAILPAQFAVFIFQISITDSAPGEDLGWRIFLIMILAQFTSVGIALSIVPNLLSGRCGKIYNQKMFDNVYSVQRSATKALIAIFQVSVQLSFFVLLLGIRYLLGLGLSDFGANTLTFGIFFLLTVPWIMFSIRLGFAIPVSTHEGGSFSEVFKRAKSINRVHFGKLFGVHCLSIFLLLLMLTPTLSIAQLLISNNIIKSAITDWVFFNLVITTLIAIIAVAYSFILTVSYFNARIEYEGFDIAVSIDQLQRETS